MYTKTKNTIIKCILKIICELLIHRQQLETFCHTKFRVLLE